MFLYRKNIILVPSDYDGISSTKGLVSFDCYEGVADCTLRTYNYISNKTLIFGVAINGKLNKFEVKPNSAKNFDFKLPFTIKNNDDIGCVLLDIEDNNYSIVLWGSTQINTAWKSTLKMMVENETDFVRQTKINNQYDINKDAYSSKFEHTSQEGSVAKINDSDESFDIQKERDNNFDFFDKINKHENQNTEIGEDSKKSEIQRSISTEEDDLDRYIEKVIELTENNDNVICDVDVLQKEEKSTDNMTNNEHNMEYYAENFYNRISSQIEKMFEINQPEKVLNEIIPSSKFCRVEFDDGNGYYVFGIIYDEGKPKYLCYGVPAQKGDKPPKEMNNLYQWLPVDINDMSGDGFYMMYQDATTGKNISVDII